jgi:octaprenyl-diphosphate synthase
MDEISRRERLDLAQVVLCAAYPVADASAQQQRRIYLAAALELLAVALTIHKLLLTDLGQSDTLDRSLAGGTVLAGDYCFSQAAAMAARTQNPAVVALFSEMLQQVSEGNLRAVMAAGSNGSGPSGPGHLPHFNEQSHLYRRGAEAGAVLAGLTGEARQQVGEFSKALAERTEVGHNGADLRSRLEGSVPEFQQERWAALLTAS